MDDFYSKKIDDSSIEYLTTYTKNLLDSMGLSEDKVTYKANDDNTYSIYYGNNLVASQIKKGDTIINAASNIQKSLQNNNSKRRANAVVPAINIVLYNVFQTLDIYNRIIKRLDNYKKYCNTDYIQGELLTYYNSMNDESFLKIALLSEYVSTVVTIISYSLACYQNKDKKIKNKLKKLIDELFNAGDNVYKGIKNINISEIMNPGSSLSNSNMDDKISINDFTDLYSSSDNMFDGQYQDIIEKFNLNLKVQYQNFLCNTEPKILNGIIENIYTQSTTFQIGTDEFYKGLKGYKDDFSNYVLSKYQHDDDYIKNESNIPNNIWNDEKTTNYDKSLLLLSYGGQGKIKELVWNFANINRDNYEFNYKYFTANKDIFDEIAYLDNWYNKDFSKMTAGDIANEYLALSKRYANDMAKTDEALSLEVSFNTTDEAESFNKALKKYGYDINLYDSYGLIFADIYTNKGIEGINNLMNEFEGNSSDDYYRNQLKTLLPLSSDLSLYQGLYNSLDSTIQGYIDDKLKLDAAKENYKMALARSLDTSMVTSDAIEKAKKNIGNDYKYLDDWQLKTYALLYQDNNMSVENLKIFDGQLKSLYSNQIASGKGYAAAVEQVKKMTGEEKDNFYSKFMKYSMMINPLGKVASMVVPNIFDDVSSKAGGVLYSAQGGIYDGIINSCGGVAKIITADGKMSADDYRKSYLQELLSADYSLFADYYDETRANHKNVLSMLSKNLNDSVLLNFKNNNGINIFNENDIKKAKENSLSLYELLYQKGYLKQEDYLKYYNLDTKKDDGNIELYANLGINPVIKDVSKWTYNIGSGVGNMVIPMALSAFVNPMAMSVWTFASVTGNEKEQLLLSGKNNDAGTFLQAACKGLLAVGTERFLGALKGYGAKADDVLKIFKMDNALMTKFMSTEFGRSFANIISNQVNETIEELVENVGDHLIDYIADGTIPSGNELLKETWMTTLSTFATTPLINLMGEGMQDSKYSYGNRMHTHNLNGMEVSYSSNELMQFTKDGILDYADFVKYLDDKGRFPQSKLYSEDQTNLKVSSPKLKDFSPEEIKFFDELLLKISNKCNIKNKTEYTDKQISEMKLNMAKLKRPGIMPETIDYLTTFYESEMQKGNPYIMGEYLSTIALFNKNDNQYSLSYNRSGKSYFDKLRKTVFLKDLLDTSHELLHARHDAFDSIDKYIVVSADKEAGTYKLSSFKHTMALSPSYDSQSGDFYVNGHNYSQIVENLRSNFKLDLFLKMSKYVSSKIDDEAEQLLLSELQAKNMTREDALKNNVKVVEQLIASHDTKYLPDLMKRVGIKDSIEITDELKTQMAEVALLSPRFTKICKEYKNFSQLTDVVSAIYGGTKNADLLSGHGYYGGAELHSLVNDDGIDRQWSEVLAQFQSLRVIAPESVDLLYAMFGDEYCNMVYGEVNKIIDNSINGMDEDLKKQNASFF